MRVGRWRHDLVRDGWAMYWICDSLCAWLPIDAPVEEYLFLARSLRCHVDEEYAVSEWPLPGDLAERWAEDVP